MSTRCIAYVDGDHQAPELAPLIAGQLQVLGAELAELKVFGALPKAVDAWRRAAAGCAVRSVVAAPAAAAQVALLFELAQSLPHHMAAAELVLIVSRERVLVAAAEHAIGQGARAMLCHSPRPGPALDSSAPVLTLPLPLPDRPAPDRFASRRALAHLDKHSRAMALLRDLRPGPHGGYLKSEVGVQLRRAGYDRAQRAAFLLRVPGVREHVIAGERLVFFDEELR